MLGARGTDEIAGGKDADAGHFKIGGEDAAAIARLLTAQMRRQNARLFISRLDQAIANAVMLGALANGKMPALLVCR